MKKFLSAAVVFGVLSLLLNASHVRRIAERTTPAFAKPVVEAVLDGAVDASEATHLDSVRRAFEDARDTVRGGKGRVVGGEQSGARYLLAGDSVMENIVPAFAEWVHPMNGTVEEYIQRGSEVGDAFVEWDREIAEIVSAERIDIVVLMVAVRGGTQEEKAARAANLARAALDAGARSVVWLAHPGMRNTRYQEGRQVGFAALNTAAQEVPGLVVLDPGTALVSSQGGYSAWIVNEQGVRVRVREADGLHLTPEGARIVVQETADLMGL